MVKRAAPLSVISPAHPKGSRQGVLRQRGPIAAGFTRSTPLRAPPLFSNLIHTTAVRMDTRTLSMPRLRRISNGMSKRTRLDCLAGPTLSPNLADLVCTGRIPVAMSSEQPHSMLNLIPHLPKRTR